MQLVVATLKNGLSLQRRGVPEVAFIQQPDYKGCVQADFDRHALSAVVEGFTIGQGITTECDHARYANEAACRYRAARVDIATRG